MTNTLLTVKQMLLFKAAFAEKNEALAALTQWQAVSDHGDLDWATRSILPLLVQRFPKNIPDFARYRHYYQQTWLTNLVKFNHLNIILNDLHVANIPVCLLKGSAMLLHYYKNMGMRPGVSDIDLLIPKEYLPQAMAVLERHQLRATSLYRHAGPDYANLVRQYDPDIMRFHHAINYHSLEMNIDLHWRISCNIQDSEFKHVQKNMQSIQLHQKKVYLLSEADHFIHTCLHGTSQITAWHKLWWLIDLLYFLDTKQASMDWEQVHCLARQYGTEAHLANALMVVRMINSRLIPKALCTVPVSGVQQLQFNLLHHRSKLMKQFCYYYSVFYVNQSGKINHFNPVMFLRFLKKYFGFSSFKNMFWQIGKLLFQR